MSRCVRGGNRDRRNHAARPGFGPRQERRCPVGRPEPARAGRPSRVTAGPVACLVLAAGLLRQGAFFAAGQWSMGLLVAGTLVVALSDHPLSWDDIRCPPVLFLLGIGGWALLDGALHGAVRDGLPTAWLAAGVVAVLVVCRRLTGPHRRVLLGGVTTAAVVVAAAGWVGVAFRSTRGGLTRSTCGARRPR